MYCDKKFIDSGYQKKHERIHTSEKTFACKYCLKTFTNSRSLKRHEKKHNGENPFPADIVTKIQEISQGTGNYSHG